MKRKKKRINKIKKEGKNETIEKPEEKRRETRKEVKPINKMTKQEKNETILENMK